MTDFITRFAPSPNGRLHLGHVFSAYVAQKLARAHSGLCLLRIEDIDIGRTREAHVEAISSDLNWIGLSFSTPVLRQSKRFDVYQTHLNRLREMGVLYPCWATRSEIRQHIETAPGGLKAWPRDPDGALLYPGLYRDISQAKRQNLMWEGRDYAWRVDMQKAQAIAETNNGGPLYFTEAYHEDLSLNHRKQVQVDGQKFGDIVIARKDVPTSYHLSVVVDDAFQNISHVTRGADLQAATHVQRILQSLLGIPAPIYVHHPLIRHLDGRRFSKTAGDLGFRELARLGWSPEQILNDLPRPIGGQETLSKELSAAIAHAMDEPTA